VGNRVRAKVVKNKIAAPFKQAEFDLLFTEGISKEGSLLDLALEEKIVTRSGSWFSYQDEQIGQGRENARLFLKENPDVAEAIKTAILQKAGLAQPAEADKEEGEAE
jgi:recombination protein RecA